MNTYFSDLPTWSTTALGLGPDALPGVIHDGSALSKHLDHCKIANKRLFAAHCAAETIHGFVIGRFVTTLVVAFVLIGCYALAV